MRKLSLGVPWGAGSVEVWASTPELLWGENPLDTELAANHPLKATETKGRESGCTAGWGRGRAGPVGLAASHHLMPNTSRKTQVDLVLEAHTPSGGAMGSI